MSLNLLLIGKSGNGKSATGNSILGGKFFSPIESSQPLTEEILKRSSIIDGKEINVVDGPRIGGTNFSNREDVELTFKKIEKALELISPFEFNAFIVVLKYGEIYTREEKDTISRIKDIFGQNVIKDYGVIVMTYGDRFANDVDEKCKESLFKAFEAWCRHQTGDFKTFFSECGQRCVLFNNRDKDDLSLGIQRGHLMTAVDKLRARPYTVDEYNKAEFGRKRIFVSSKLSIIEQVNRRGLNEIMESLTQIDIQDDLESVISKLIGLHERLDTHKAYLQTESDGTDVLKHLFVQLKTVDMRLNNKLKLLQIRQQEGNEISHTQGRGLFQSFRKTLLDFISRTVVVTVGLFRRH